MQFWVVIFITYSVAPLCNRPLGLESGRIPNAKITSSSAYNARYTAPNGRLNKPFCWIARHKNHNQWFKVDFGRVTTVRKIATQGRRDANQWVTRYKLTYSLDTLHWATYRQRSQDKVRLHRNLFETIMYNGRSVVKIKIFFIWWSFDLFSWPQWVWFSVDGVRRLNTHATHNSSNRCDEGRNVSF